MDALDVLKVCLRRWYVMLPVLVLALGAGVGLAQNQEQQYTASGSFALVYTHGEDIKPNEVDPRGANPLAGENARLLGEALVSAYMSKPRQEDLGKSGTSGVAPGDPDNGTSFSVSLPENSQSYRVEAWGPDPEAVKDVVNAVIASAPDLADQIQERAGATLASRYTTFTTAPTQVSDLPPPSKVKLVVTLVGVGVLAGAALSIIADRMLYRRRRQRADRAPATGPAADPAATPLGARPDQSQQASEKEQRLRGDETPSRAPAMSSRPSGSDPRGRGRQPTR